MKDGMSKFFKFKIIFFCIKEFIFFILVEDWDTFEKVLDYLYGDCLIAESQHHSVLFTEAPVIYYLSFFGKSNFLIFFSGMKKINAKN